MVAEGNKVEIREISRKDQGRWLSDLADTLHSVFQLLSHPFLTSLASSSSSLFLPSSGYLVVHLYSSIIIRRQVSIDLGNAKKILLLNFLYPYIALFDFNHLLSINKLCLSYFFLTSNIFLLPFPFDSFFTYFLTQARSHGVAWGGKYHPMATGLSYEGIYHPIPPLDQVCTNRGRGGVALPIFSNLQESWSKATHAARELATVFSVTFFCSNSWLIGQNALPPEQKVSRHIATLG